MWITGGHVQFIHTHTQCVTHSCLWNKARKTCGTERWTHPRPQEEEEEDDEERGEGKEEEEEQREEVTAVDESDVSVTP